LAKGAPKHNRPLSVAEFTENKFHCSTRRNVGFPVHVRSSRTNNAASVTGRHHCWESISVSSTSTPTSSSPSSPRAKQFSERVERLIIIFIVFHHRFASVSTFLLPFERSSWSDRFAVANISHALVLQRFTIAVSTAAFIHPPSSSAQSPHDEEENINGTTKGKPSRPLFIERHR
jgi:hypothetical protein